jgi:DNA-binding MarR family transcriptional regulator
LIAKGLVTRSADTSDGRRSVLRLTRQGTNLVRQAPRAIQEDLIDGFVTLRPSERRGLTIGLEKWLTASGLGGVRSTMLFERPLLTKRPARGSKRK